jgi:hypothetical protein
MCHGWGGAVGPHTIGAVNTTGAGAYSRCVSLPARAQVLLPNGQVLLVNGAKFGNSNGGGPYGGSQARDPSYQVGPVCRGGVFSSS